MNPDTKAMLTMLPANPQLDADMQTLLQLSDQDVPKVPEDLFIHHILPILTNTEERVDLSVWQDLAGSVMRPLDVVDYRGEVLFRVPALLSTQVTQPNPGHQRSMSTIMATAKLKSEQLPVMGLMYLERMLTSRLPDSRLDLATATQWNAILKRYDQPLLPLPTADAAPVADPVSLFSGEDDDL